MKNDEKVIRDNLKILRSLFEEITTMSSTINNIKNLKDKIMVNDQYTKIVNALDLYIRDYENIIGLLDQNQDDNNE